MFWREVWRQYRCTNVGIAKAITGLVTRWLCEGEWLSRAARRKPRSCLSRFV